MTDKWPLTEALELVAFRNFRFVVGVSGANLVLVHDDSVVIDLAKAVSLLEVVPTDFVIEWNVVALAEARDTHVDVMDPGIVVHKDNIVVKDKDVDNEHGELDQKGHEKANEPRRLRLLIVVI